MIEVIRDEQFALARDVSLLGPREKNAVKVVLSGLCEEQLAGKKIGPLKIVNSPENPFKLNEFAKVMYDMGIDIISSMWSDKDAVKTTHNCFPRPYEHNNFIKQLTSSYDVKDQFVESFLDYDQSKISQPRK